MDHAQVNVVARHLVDDALGARVVAPESFDIGRAALSKISIRRSRRRAWAKPAAGGRQQISCERPMHLGQMLDHELELTRAIYQRVARQNLLDQCAAGAWHADDEDGKAGRMTEAGMPIQEWLVEDGLDLRRI